MSEEEKSIAKEEHNIITIKDIVPNPDMLGNYEEAFHCPKCNSNLIYLWEKYAANNTANSMDKENGWRKLILCCDSCGYGDLILKFLKKREDTYNRIYEPIGTYPKRRQKPYYYTGGPLISSSITQQPSKSIWKKTI